MKDEILAKALESDTEIVPRYDVVLPDGTKVAENAELVLKNPVTQEGTPYNTETVLQDTTAALYGLEEATVDEVLSSIPPTYAKASDVYTKLQTLSDDTRDILGLASGATPDDAFSTIGENIASPKSPYIYLGSFDASNANPLSINLSQIDDSNYNGIRLYIRHEATSSGSGGISSPALRVNNLSGSSSYYYFYTTGYEGEYTSNGSYPEVLLATALAKFGEFNLYIVDLFTDQADNEIKFIINNIASNRTGSTISTSTESYFPSKVIGRVNSTSILNSVQIVFRGVITTAHKISGTVWGRRK